MSDAYPVISEAYVHQAAGRAVRVALFGNSKWAAKVKTTCHGEGMETNQLYVDMEHAIRRWSVRQWLAEEELWKHDVIHVVGWPRLWSLWVAARLRRTPAILHWIGSDVSSFLLSPRMSRLAGPLLNLLVPCHLGDATNLVEELRTVGIHAMHEPVGIPKLKDVKAPPLPDRPAVLSYLPESRFEFYGGEQILWMAQQAPELTWLVVANDGAKFPQLPNVKYLGYVQDMDRVYRDTTVLVRLTRHDGTGVMPIEAMARGRHVVWSHPMPHCRLAREAEPALNEIRQAVACGELNTAGAAFVHAQYDNDDQGRRLQQLYTRLASRKSAV